MAATPPIPTPYPTPVTRPFWEGLQDHKVRIQYSPSTAQWVFYPRLLAPRTLADDLEWREIPGRGHVYAFTIARYPTAPAWKDKLPQILAVVQFDEGPRLTTEILNVAPEQVQVGMRVRPVFCDDPHGGVTLLRFEPADGAETL